MPPTLLRSGFGKSVKATITSIARAIASVATRKLTAPTVNGAPMSARRRPVTAPWTGQHAPADRGSTDKQHPAQIEDEEAAHGAGLPEHDGGGARQHRERAYQCRSTEARRGNAKKTEAIQNERCRHLPGYDQPDGHDRPEPWEQQDRR